MADERPEYPFERRRRERAEAAEAARQRAAENPTDRRPSWLRSYMDQLEESQRAFRGRGRQPSTPPRQAAPEPAPSRPAVPASTGMGDVPSAREDRTGSAGAARMREIDMQAADVPGNRAMSPPAARRPQPAPAPAARRQSEADDLNEIVLRLNRGEKPVTETEKRLADRMGIAYRKGGLVKPKGHGAKEEAMEMKGGRYRGGAKEERAEMKAKGGIIKSKAKSPANLKGKTLMKKGGEASLASGLRGGVVKKPGTDSFNFQAKKMATGGVVPEGGSKYGFTTAKTKMLRRGGMAKGCK